jgi:hypothetical protein
MNCYIQSKSHVEKQELILMKSSQSANLPVIEASDKDYIFMSCEPLSKFSF